MQVYSFEVFGKPIGQPRPRATAFNGHARVYEPAKHPVQEFKAAIRQQAGAVFSHPLAGPIGISIACIFPRSKAVCWKSKPMPPLEQTSKPDVDNIVKAVLDALTSTAWHDDTQVTECQVRKWIAPGDEQPRTVVRLWQQTEPTWQRPCGTQAVVPALDRLQEYIARGYSLQLRERDCALLDTSGVIFITGRNFRDLLINLALNE